MVVRRVSAGEALGGVTVICTDKTGTLTQNRMELQTLRLPGGDLDLQRFRASPDHVFDDPGTLAFATAPVAIVLVRRVGRATAPPQLVAVLVATARLELVTSLLLAVGLWIG